MNTIRREERSTTAPRYSSLAISVQVFYQNFRNRLTVFVSLIGYQVLTQPVCSELLRFRRAVNQFYTTSLTTAAGVYLSFNNPLITANL